MLHKQVDGLIFVNNSHPLDISSLPQGIMQGSSPEYRTVIVPHEIVERATTLGA